MTVCTSTMDSRQNPEIFQKLIHKQAAAEVCAWLEELPKKMRHCDPCMCKRRQTLGVDFARADWVQWRRVLGLLLLASSLDPGAARL